MKALVVEDEAIIRESLKMDIMRLDHGCVYDVYTAESVREAEDIFINQKPDLVITDINMPGESGLVLIEKIRRINEDCVIIVLSAYDNFEFVRQAFLSGANEYILKPIAFSVLDEKIRYLLCDDSSTVSDSEDERAIRHKMQGAIDFIHNNFSRAISMSDAADAIFFSYSHFSRLFRQYTGMTFPQYLLKTRMEKAKEYLSDPYIKIAQVAQKVGYGDNSQHFSRDFHKVLNMTPSEYQKYPDKL